MAKRSHSSQHDQQCSKSHEDGLLQNHQPSVDTSPIADKQPQSIGHSTSGIPTATTTNTDTVVAVSADLGDRSSRQPTAAPPCYRSHEQLDIRVSELSSNDDRMSACPPLYYSRERLSVGRDIACPVHRSCTSASFGEPIVDSCVEATQLVARASTPAFHRHSRAGHPHRTGQSSHDDEEVEVIAIESSSRVYNHPTESNRIQSVTVPFLGDHVIDEETTPTAQEETPATRVKWYCGRRDYVTVSRLGTCMVVLGVLVVLASLLVLLVYSDNEVASRALTGSGLVLALLGIMVTLYTKQSAFVVANDSRTALQQDQLRRRRQLLSHGPRSKLDQRSYLPEFSLPTYTAYDEIIVRPPSYIDFIDNLEDTPIVYL